ncbi:hypothetical protein [Nocardioides sp.]|uniref:hypothetical protein n=1 Tax=Nocardioides sp. TaxID=35761 RepID=UPI0039E72ACD
MSTTELVVTVLTVLAGLVVLLTRLRLRGSHAGVVLALHTWLGLLGVVVWLVFVLAPDDSKAGDALVGVIGLGCWWVTSLAGLVLMFRWWPSRRRGKRAADVVDPADRWTGGPWLWLPAHLAVFAMAVWFTWIYLWSIV